MSRGEEFRDVRTLKRGLWGLADFEVNNEVYCEHFRNNRITRTGVQVGCTPGN